MLKLRFKGSLARICGNSGLYLRIAGVALFGLIYNIGEVWQLPVEFGLKH